MLALLLPAIFLLGFVGGQVVDVGPRQSGASSSYEDHPAFASFQESWDLVHERYVVPEEIDDEALIYGAAEGMVEALGDTGHSSFLNPTDAEAFRASLKGELIGIGVRIDFDSEFPTVIAPISGSPADNAGIEAGDIIMSIDGAATDRMEISEVTGLLRGAEGDDVVLEVGRPDDGSEFTVTLTRARIKIQPVSWAYLPDDLMLIRLSEFSSGADAALRKALQKARRGDAKGIVLDLRGNPGGLVTEAIKVAHEFLPEGEVLYQQQNREGELSPVVVQGTDGLALEIPLVVLIDRGSASAAEIVAASLHDNGRAELVGEQTFGTGTVVSSYTLDDGSIAAIGTALWKTPDGELVRDVGVPPSIPQALPPGVDPIEFDSDTTLSIEVIHASEDEQLERAIDELLQTSQPSETANEG
jgi:carboxyl-terminal processing protease